jgi:hypothetical protein
VQSNQHCSASDDSTERHVSEALTSILTMENPTRCCLDIRFFRRAGRIGYLARGGNDLCYVRIRSRVRGDRGRPLFSLCPQGLACHYVNPSTTDIPKRAHRAGDVRWCTQVWFFHAEVWPVCRLHTTLWHLRLLRLVFTVQHLALLFQCWTTLYRTHTLCCCACVCLDHRDPAKVRYPPGVRCSLRPSL